jgi:hypothetical protein
LEDIANSSTPSLTREEILGGIGGGTLAGAVSAYFANLRRQSQAVANLAELRAPLISEMEMAAAPLALLG